ncbi:helix-turn-helix transcriptional regulator [Alteraurantiacibacter aquimixticola]|uniref:HTH luxR-type domain-containing protein n=1 Tax=Alteraurantiacibacter aquimixticola TaxID=2489173 RepID=A0A4T3F597_9SPHN|nr:LuxR C-terminal-related transcriptional regulator [Alteraurantiacibacter aquimixticola]TIX51554.1 hypothetical protein E5222_03620 [Alteraurantiacibacter aquimixticola]
MDTELPAWPGREGAEALLQAQSALDGRARLLLDRSGRLVAACRMAWQLIRKQELLAHIDGQVRAVCEEDARLVASLLEVAEGKRGSACLGLTENVDPLFIHAAATGPDHVCWVLASAQSMHRRELPDLNALFGLTPSEARIIEDLFAGMTPQEIANHHSNSIHTVRVHIKHCYEKMGVNCREEMWVKLQSCAL